MICKNDVSLLSKDYVSDKDRPIEQYYTGICKNDSIFVLGFLSTDNMRLSHMYYEVIISSRGEAPLLIKLDLRQNDINRSFEVVHS